MMQIIDQQAIWKILKMELLLVLSFAIIPGLIVLSVVSSIIGIFHLCGHFIDYIASKTIYKPKTPERGMINEFNKLLDD